jgi:hypothetical protein
MRKCNYHTDEYPFAKLVQEHFDCLDLRYIHTKASREYEVFERDNDFKTEFHEKFYEIGDVFYSVYEAFVRNTVASYFDEPVVYQRIPNFRIHMPDNLAVGEFHRDTDYGHSEDEINIFLPLTSAYATNTFWVESKKGKQDFAPAELAYGQFGIWSGTREHGNYLNTTGISRVSLDFRIMLRSKYSARSQHTINTKMKFEIGGYFDE